MAHEHYGVDSSDSSDTGNSFAGTDTDGLSSSGTSEWSLLSALAMPGELAGAFSGLEADLKLAAGSGAAHASDAVLHDIAQAIRALPAAQVATLFDTLRAAAPQLISAAPAAAAPIAAALQDLDTTEATAQATAVASQATASPASLIKTTQIAIGADVATSLYGVTGTGEKIGIISDSFNNTGGAATDMANGILPNVNVLYDQSSGGTDEGRAMIEIANSIAPGATYYFASANGPGGTEGAVAALQNAGVNIIAEDIGLGVSESQYQVGSNLDNAISTAIAGGVNYFTSTGNDGDDYYQQGFKPLATTIPGIGAVTANDFGGGSPYLSVTIPANFTISEYFEWAQPFASYGTGANSAQNSMAIYLLDSSGNIVASSTVNEVGKNPTQELDFTNNTSNANFRIVVVQNGGTIPAGESFTITSYGAATPFNSPTAGTGSGDLFGHKLVPGANDIAAINYNSTPAFGVSPAVLENFSSVGPGTIYFDAQGNPLATPLTVNHPLFAGVDGTTVAAAGTGTEFSPFAGTSAATPAVAAVSALMLSANPTLTTAQVTAVLAQSVIPDVQISYSGAGLTQARAAVEIAAGDGGDRWKAATNSDWATGANWTGGAAPTATQAASLGDNLGAFTGAYTVTVDTAGDTAGSLAISAPAGSSATLSIVTGGSLAIAGTTPGTANAADVTSGDFLVSDNGTLSITGGTLTETGSLNNNNGTVTIASGTATANNYAQNAGLLTVGGAATLPAAQPHAAGVVGGTLTLTGTGVAETGGVISIIANGTVNTTTLSDSASTFSTSTGGSLVASGAATFTSGAIVGDAGSFQAASFGFTQSTFTETGSLTTTGALTFDDTAATISSGATASVGSLAVGSTVATFPDTLTLAGKLTDSGALSMGTSTSGGNIVLQAGSELDIAGATSDATIQFAGAALIDFDSTSAAVTQLQLNSTISGFNTAGAGIDFGNIAYNAADTYTYKSGELDLFNPGGNELAALFIAAASAPTTFALINDAGTEEVVCFLAGTTIATPDGGVAIETLRAGDLVLTSEGVAQPIRWLGRQTVATRFADALRVAPIRIREGALGENLPVRDLLVSPDHALMVDGVFVQAGALVNGVSIIREDADMPERFTYFHVELADHSLILAEGVAAETFIDNVDRLAFDNWDEHVALGHDTAPMSEMAHARAKAHRQVPKALRQRLMARGLELAGSGAAVAA